MVCTMTIPVVAGGVFNNKTNVSIYPIRKAIHVARIDFPLTRNAFPLTRNTFPLIRNTFPLARNRHRATS